jgi:hypothetical protein
MTLPDRMFCWNAVDLARKVGDFKFYYNGSRCHQSLSGTPSEKIWRAGAAARFTRSVRFEATLPRPFSNAAG